MKKILFFMVVITLLISTSNTVFANVFAFNVSVSTTGAPMFSYRLNENASAVNVQIYGPLPATSVIRDVKGTTLKGLNSFIFWDGLTNSGATSSPGNYGFKIIATDSVGHNTWTVISDDNTRTFQFENPRGMSINNYNDGNPYFGMIYVGNTRNVATGTGRPMTDGLYGFYPDGSDPLSLGDVGRNDGCLSVWSTGGTNSPYHLFVSPSYELWIGDWSDLNSGVWRAPADLSGTFTMILDSTGRSGTGLVAGIHGSIAGLYVENTGSNTILYTQDEDYPANAEPQMRSIWKYNIGNGPFPWTGSPTVVVDDSTFLTYPGSSTAGILVNDTGGGIAKDSAGRIYVTNNRSAGTDFPSLMVFSSPSTLVWDSLSAGANYVVSSTADPLRGNQKGVAVDNARGRIITGGLNGFNVTPMSLPVGNLTTAYTNVPWVTLSNTTVVAARGQVAIDAAGNVYISDNIGEKVRIYSPPDGINAFTTITNFSVPGGTFFNLTDVKKTHWEIYE